MVEGGVWGTGDKGWENGVQRWAKGARGELYYGEASPEVRVKGVGEWG